MIRMIVYCALCIVHCLLCIVYCVLCILLYRSVYTLCLCLCSRLIPVPVPVPVLLLFLFSPTQQQAKNGWKLKPKPFFRDAGAFAIASVCTFIVYETWTPMYLYWYECLFLTLAYVTYIVILITTDKCITPPLTDEEQQFIEAATAAAVVGKRASLVTFRCVLI